MLAEAVPNCTGGGNMICVDGTAADIGGSGGGGDKAGGAGDKAPLWSVLMVSLADMQTCLRGF